MHVYKNSSTEETMQNGTLGFAVVGSTLRILLSEETKRQQETSTRTRVPILLDFRSVTQYRVCFVVNKNI